MTNAITALHAAIRDLREMTAEINSALTDLDNEVSDLARWMLGMSGHKSDCALHNVPAYPPGPCDCGVWQEEFAVAWREWSSTHPPEYRHAIQIVGIGCTDKSATIQGGDIDMDGDGFALMRPDDADPENGQHP